jgi:hypothetical protein
MYHIDVSFAKDNWALSQGDEIWFKMWLTGIPDHFSSLFDIKLKYNETPKEPIPEPEPELSPIPPPMEVVDFDISKEAKEIGEECESPNTNSSSPKNMNEESKQSKRKRTTNNNRPAQKRPRVPKEQCIIYTHATEETRSEMVLPRSKKITAEQNKLNVAEIKNLEEILIQRNKLDDALENRPLLPFKAIYDLGKELKSLENSLNRKATDHYNKLRFAWNESEVSRLKAFIESLK